MILPIQIRFQNSTQSYFKYKSVFIENGNTKCYFLVVKASLYTITDTFSGTFLHNQPSQLPRKGGGINTVIPILQTGPQRSYKTCLVCLFDNSLTHLDLSSFGSPIILLLASSQPLGQLSFILLFFKKYFWLCWVLVVAHGIFSCGMLDIQWEHVGSSSLIRDQTWAPCIGRMESQPLDCHGNPFPLVF